MDKVRCNIEPHADFSIEWDSDFEGSISTSKMLEGRVIMKYSSVPRFVFELSKRFDNFDFLSEKQKKEIMKCEKVSFADAWYDEIAASSGKDAEFFRGVWSGSFIDEKGERRTWDEQRLYLCRCSEHMTRILETMKAKGLDNVEYSGIVYPGSEYVIPLHILSSPNKETYISQYWQGVNILRTKEGQTKEIVGDIARLYGVAVSGSLRSLLEKSCV